MCDQQPDTLIFEGRRIAIEPLQIEENNAISYVPDKTMACSTGHIRGYTAEWKLVDKKLYLLKLHGCYQLKSTLPIFADWINGVIRPATGSYGESFTFPITNGRRS